MGSFQAKIGWKRLRKREDKNYRSVTFVPDGLQKIPKKWQKYFEKLKNAIMATFQAKIGWKMLRKRKYKNYHSATFLPDGLKKIPKNSKKI